MTDCVVVGCTAPAAYAVRQPYGAGRTPSRTCPDHLDRMVDAMKIGLGQAEPIVTKEK